VKPREGHASIVCSGASLSLAFFLAALACAPRAHGPLRQEAYVWQRDWSPAVRAAVADRTSPLGLAGLNVLAAQVDPVGGPSANAASAASAAGPLRILRVAYDPVSLRRSGLPVGLSIRIGTFPGRMGERPDAVAALSRLLRDLLAAAGASGLAPVEIQLDYDCPESKLDDYRELLLALRPAVAPVPLTLTALPAWLDHRRDFARLIAAADGYVLQVHSLAPPPSPTAGFVLCRPEDARRWVEAAARFGRPFRVALPTYGYVAAFDAQGHLLGLAAEGAPVLGERGATLRSVRSDPAAMAALVRGWRRDRPAELTGILWYRLPVASDHLNWSPTTLRAVMSGREPRTDLRAATRTPEPGLIEVDLVNTGEAEAPEPAAVHLRWHGAPPLAADALAGYRLRPAPRADPNGVFLEAAAGSAARTLRPGDRRTIAWLRFAGAEPVEVEIAPAPPQPGPLRVR
jgi:hypothetical protein